MNNRGRGKTSNSVSNVATLGRQRKAIGEFQAKRASKAKGGGAPLPTAPGARKTGKTSDGFKIRSYADVRRVEKRKETMQKAQAVTPYASDAHYAVATGGLSAPQIAKRTARKGDSATVREQKEDNKATFLAEMGVYRSTRPANMAQGVDGKVAILHSFQDDAAKQKALTDQGIDSREHVLQRHGNIYEPNIYGNTMGHDMRSNSAWLLGLAHHGHKAILSAPLDDRNLVRQSAPVGEKTTDKHLSALGREVLGMVQKGHFALGPNDSFGNQTLQPTASAARATLSDFKTPKGVPQGRLKQTFQDKGLDVSKIR